MKDVQSVTELLQALVRIPSVNPEGVPGCDQVGEKACGEFVAGFLRGIGAAVELEEVLPGRPNVTAVWPSDRPGKPRLIFAPHLDTVSVVGMTIDPFSGEVRDERVWGRGASDTKGPMASMLWALREMRDELPRLSHEIVFAGLVGEEAGQHGAKAFVAKHGGELWKRGGFVMAGEPTSLNAVIAHKGALWLTLTTRGVAVHAAQPQAGVNAIYKMADVLRKIRDKIAPALAMIEHPILGHATISVGIVNGGSKTNIVPDECRAEVDIRFLPGDDKILKRLTKWLKAVCEDIEIQHAISQPMLTDESHPMVEQLKECGAKAVGAPWFSDAAIFAQAGIPAIAIGPGSIAQAHTNDEWMSVRDLEEGAAFFKGFLGSLGR